MKVGCRRSIARVASVVVLLFGCVMPARAQSDVDERLRQLDRALEEIKAGMRNGDDVSARVAAFEQELEKLKQERAAELQYMAKFKFN